MGPMRSEAELAAWLDSIALDPAMDTRAFVAEALSIENDQTILDLYRSGDEQQKRKALAALRARGRGVSRLPEGGLQLRIHGSGDRPREVDPSRLTYAYLTAPVATVGDWPPKPKVSLRSTHHPEDEVLVRPKVRLRDEVRAFKLPRP